MSLLTICQNVADFTGFERETTIIGNTSPTARQLLALAQREGKQLMRSHTWPILLKEHTFSTANGTQSYALPTDFDRFVGDTAFNRTDLDKFTGPLTPTGSSDGKLDVTADVTSHVCAFAGDISDKEIICDFPM